MKKILFSLLLIIFCFVSLSYAYFSNEFLSLDQIKEDIKTYYKEILKERCDTISILDIYKTEKDSDYISVFFLKDKNPNFVKDFSGYIRSSVVPVMEAVYVRSLLKNAWVLKNIAQVKGERAFKVD